jgi:hypothetical protein
MLTALFLLVGDPGHLIFDSTSRGSWNKPPGSGSIIGNHLIAVIIR